MKKINILYKINFITLFLFPYNSFASNIFAVYDFKNNKMLESQNENLSRPIASITKLMTANVFLENNKNKNCQTQILEEDKDKIKGTRSKLPLNVSISCDELLKAMLVHSDNYAAHALSHSTHLSKEEFVKAMNIKAKKLGMKNTYFEDSSGLSSNNISSINDLIKLSKYSLNNPKIKYLTNLPLTEININSHKKILMKNTNKLVSEKHYQASLNKTGYISESGYNLVFINAYNCNNKKIGVISLNNTSSQSRSDFTSKKLKKYGCLALK